MEYAASEVWFDVHGTLTHCEATGNIVPVDLTLGGVEGERGHYACGLFGMTQYREAYPGYPYTSATLKATLHRADVGVDRGFLRFALATAWKHRDTGETYFLEFDLWDSKGTRDQMEDPSYVYYDPAGAPPTIEVKTCQLDMGREAHLTIPVYRYFVKAFGIAEVELDGAYLVFEKTDMDSVVDAEWTVASLELGKEVHII